MAAQAKRPSTKTIVKPLIHICDSKRKMYVVPECDYNRDKTNVYCILFKSRNSYVPSCEDAEPFEVTSVNYSFCPFCRKRLVETEEVPVNAEVNKQ